MVAIYILRLEQNKFYVGMTKRNIERIWEHIDGKGAAWTKKYPPCEGNEILYFEEGLDPSDENRKTIEMMKRFGIHNVRGGDYCRVKMPSIEVARLRRKINSLKKFHKTVTPLPLNFDDSLFLGPFQTILFNEK